MLVEFCRDGVGWVWHAQQCLGVTPRDAWLMLGMEPRPPVWKVCFQLVRFSPVTSSVLVKFVLFGGHTLQYSELIPGFSLSNYSGQTLVALWDAGDLNQVGLLRGKQNTLPPAIVQAPSPVFKLRHFKEFIFMLVHFYKRIIYFVNPMRVKDYFMTSLTF